MDRSRVTAPWCKLLGLLRPLQSVVQGFPDESRLCELQEWGSSGVTDDPVGAARFTDRRETEGLV